MYKGDTGDVYEKWKAAEEITKRAILVTANVVGFYPCIAHNGVLEILLRQFDKFTNKNGPTEDIITVGTFLS